MAALLAGSPLVLAVLTVAGAGYLVWLGIGMLRHPSAVHASAESGSHSVWRQVVKGFGISGLNPKVFLLFLALLPQFVVATAAWPVAAQILVLGLVHVVNCAVVYTGVGIGARRVLGARPAAAGELEVLGSGVVRIGDPLDQPDPDHRVDQLGHGLLARAQRGDELAQRNRAPAQGEQHEPERLPHVGPAAGGQLAVNQRQVSRSST